MNDRKVSHVKIGLAEYDRLKDRKGKYEVIMPCGSRYFYLDSMWHREDGPALVESDGSFHYYLNGKRHRTDGPSSMWPDGTSDYCLNEEKYCKDSFIKQLTDKQLEAFLLNPENF